MTQKKNDEESPWIEGAILAICFLMKLVAFVVFVGVLVVAFVALATQVLVIAPPPIFW
jgi:hypothetical protein